MYLISTYSEIGPTMNASNYELEFDLNKVHIPIVEEILGMLDERLMQLVMNPLKKLTMCKSVMWWLIEYDSRMSKVH